MTIHPLWLRAESLEFERRTPLSPEHAAELIQTGIPVFVERSEQRIYPNADYESAGCQLVEQGSHDKAAPSNAYILGIKALPDSTAAIRHRHIYFGHAYKDQPNAGALLERFSRGGGCLFDLEYLVDAAGGRLCYFGFWSGVAGAALSLLCWSQGRVSKPTAIPLFYSSETELLKDLNERLVAAGDFPSAIVIGHRGNCGRGVKHVLQRFPIKTTLWDREEMSSMDNYSEIFQHSLLFNCAYVTKAVRPFITPTQLAEATDKPLVLINDISCDAGSPHNPLPIYDSITRFDQPLQTVRAGKHAVELIAIDHLPSFLPKESSNDFSKQLVPQLKDLLTQSDLPPVWQRLYDRFGSHTHAFG